jgi:hypothetical protein
MVIKNKTHANMGFKKFIGLTNFRAIGLITK